MPDLAPWPDPHDLLFVVLDDLTESPVVGPLLWPEFQKFMPLIRVRKVGGINDRLTDIPRMAVDVYAADYETSRNLAEAIRQRLLSETVKAKFAPGVGRIDRVEVESSPFEVPWSDESTRYHTAIYRISTRR